MTESSSKNDLDEAREFFRLQERRFTESGMMPLPETTEADSGSDESDDFSPEEARKLLWESEDMKQPVIGYKILEKLGGGGSAAVFRALSMSTRTEVALKLLYPQLHEDPKSLREFIREGMTLIRLNHPNILRGLDFGFSKGFYFMVLELAQGHSIARFLDAGKAVREAEAVRIGAQVLRALEHVAGHGIVHRDVKPGNILVVDKRTAKLCDFGLCLDTKKRAVPAAEEEETTCGTVEYLSPEQARGRTDLDVRSDLYSLGATLFHMISGQLPFSGSNPREVMEKHIRMPLDFTGYERWFSQPMRRILARLMAKDRDERYAAPAEVLADLEVVYGMKIV